METYEEILKDALNSKSTPFEVQSWIEEKFPFLKESEDEKIRKWLIDYLNNRILNLPFGAEKEAISRSIAWLEKQGDIDRRIQEEIEKQTKQQWKEWDAEKKELKKIEQKPASGEEGYDVMINKLLAVVNLYYDRSGNDLDKQSCISFLKSLKNRVGCESNYTTTKDWSEEDEKFINRSIMYLRQYNSSESEVKRRGTQSCINWLEALRDGKLNDQSIIKYKIGDKVQFYTDGAVYTISKVENGKYIFADGGDDASIYEELIPVEESKDTLTRYNVKCGDYLSHKDGTIIKVHDIDCFDRIHFFYYANDMSEDGGQIQDNRAFMAHCGIIQDCRFATEDEIDFLEKWVAHKKYIWGENNVTLDDEEED